MPAAWPQVLVLCLNDACSNRGFDVARFAVSLVYGKRLCRLGKECLHEQLCFVTAEGEEVVQVMIQATPEQ